MVAHPPCTYLSNAGSRWLFENGKLNNTRYNKGLQAKAFFMKLYNAPIKYKAIENPTPIKIFKIPKHSQVIQPYEYGEPYSKRTLLWLVNLPLLQPTKILREYEHICQAIQVVKNAVKNINLYQLIKLIAVKLL